QRERTKDDQSKGGVADPERKRCNSSAGADEGPSEAPYLRRPRHLAVARGAELGEASHVPGCAAPTRKMLALQLVLPSLQLTDMVLQLGDSGMGRLEVVAIRH